MSHGFKKFLAWCGAILFGFGLLAGIAAQFGGDETKPPWTMLLFYAALFAWPAYWLWKNSASTRSKSIDKLTAEATQWSEAFNRNELPAVDTMGVMVPSGERALIAERSQIAEVATRRKSSFAGTRVRIGKLPLYFGGSESVSRKEMRVSDTGTALLTDKSIIFAGGLRTFAISLKDVVQISPSLDAISVSSKGRATPLIIGVRNPILWSGVIRSLAGSSA